MSKPLELTVHRPFQDRQGNDWYVWSATCVRPWIADSYSEMKRFTDSELAAEFWFANVRPACAKDNPKGYGTIVRELGSDNLSALARFATLPHYDEDQP